MAQTPTGSATRPSSSGRVTDDDIELARHQVVRAFELLGLAGAGGQPRCPICGTDKKGKVQLKNDKGYWKCYKPHEPSYGSPINLLMDHGGYSFPDAVNALLGRPLSSDTPREVKTREPVKIEVEPDFTAVIDTEVTAWIARHGDRAKAQAYYDQWHISPRAVAEAGCFSLPHARRDMRKLQEQAIETFGFDRLVACGIAMEPSDDKWPWFPGLPNGYPIVEPHVTPDGKITYYQTRPVGKDRAKVEAHKAGKRAKKAAEARGETYDREVPPYTMPFSSLKGSTHDAMIGGGVWRIAKLEPGSTIVVVEGIKDLLAARTLGAEAYAIPGAGTLPPQATLDLLARHKVLVALDGDDAGEAGRDRAVEALREAGVDANPKDMPSGMDVTDILVDRHAKAGCDCSNCRAWRER